MADDPAPVRDVTVPPNDFRDVVESAGVQLKERLLNKRDAATKTYGFDLHGIQPYLDILSPVLSHKVSGVALAQKEIITAQYTLQELSERHSGGKLHKLKICVSTKTIKHDKTTINNVNPFKTNRKVVWLLALSVDEEEKDKIGRSFSLDTRFNLVEKEIFVSYEVV
jgi:hypothetical protein